MGDEWPNHSFSEGSSTLSGSVFSFITLDKTNIDPHTTSLPCLLASQDVTTGAKPGGHAAVHGVDLLRRRRPVRDGGGRRQRRRLRRLVSSATSPASATSRASRRPTARSTRSSCRRAGPGVSCAHDPKARRCGSPLAGRVDRQAVLVLGDRREDGRRHRRAQDRHPVPDPPPLVRRDDERARRHGQPQPQCAGEVAVPRRRSTPCRPGAGQPAPKWTFPVHAMPSDSGGTASTSAARDGVLLEERAGDEVRRRRHDGQSDVRMGGAQGERRDARLHDADRAEPRVLSGPMAGAAQSALEACAREEFAHAPPLPRLGAAIP